MYYVNRYSWPRGIWMSGMMKVLWGFSIFLHVLHSHFWNQTKNQDTWFDKYLCTYGDIRRKYLFLNSITALLEPWKYTCASPILTHHTHLHVHSHTVLCSTLSAHLYEIILSTQENRTTQRPWYVCSTSYFASLASFHCQQGGAIDAFGATFFFFSTYIPS